MATTSTNQSRMFFIFGMNISYFLFSDLDLPINYNEFHETAANVITFYYTPEIYEFFTKVKA